MAEHNLKIGQSVRVEPSNPLAKGRGLGIVHHVGSTLVAVRFAGEQYPIACFRRDVHPVDESKTRYRINWDNGHDCGTLAGEYTSKRKAEQEARAWKRGMVDIECTAYDRKVAREAYQWEVVEVEPEPELDAEAAPDNPRPDWY